MAVWIVVLNTSKTNRKSLYHRKCICCPSQLKSLLIKLELMNSSTKALFRLLKLAWEAIHSSQDSAVLLKDVSPFMLVMKLFHICLTKWFMRLLSPKFHMCNVSNMNPSQTHHGLEMALLNISLKYSSKTNSPPNLKSSKLKRLTKLSIISLTFQSKWRSISTV